ncbi:MAG: DVU_1551 family NTP transferase [Dehalococcoidia bacterium]
MERPGITAIILAAGYSERMKQFKPLLDLGGQPVIERVISSFVDAGVADIRVVAGHCQEKLIPALVGLNVRIVINDRYAEGMFSSVQAGLGSLEAETGSLFILPADIPLVRAQTIQYLIERSTFHRGRILIPSFLSRRGHPPVVPAEHIEFIRRYSGGKGLKGALSMLQDDTTLIPVADENILFDMDTPAKYLELRERWKRRHIPSPDECRAIASMFGMPEHTLRHCRAVADIAGSMTDALNSAGCAVERDLIVAAALLHDLARDRPGHAGEAARLVAESGFPEAAALIATHMDITAGSGGSVSAAEVLYLADKLVQEDRQVSLEQRFGQKLEREAGKTQALHKIELRYRTARSIQERIVALTGG